jgi:NAD(P)-dependent dehydrogenase (short-subunit alcohol dehydrogenase family)
MQELEGKVAVVTGAGSGIGRALVQRFADEGMDVAAADVDEAALEETVASLTAAGERVTGRVTSRVVDVSDAAQVDAFADQVFAEHGAVDVLCNNAGVFAGGLLWTRPVDDFAWVFGVNLWGVLHGIRAFVPRMIEQGTEGHIVNTCSAAGLFGSPYTGPYTISKFAAFAASESLASDLASVGSQLKVSALCPGAVDTDIPRSDRHRPDRWPAERSADAELIETALRDTTARGLPPEEVAGQVVEAIRSETFLVLTSESYRPSLRTRTDALVEGRLPPLATFD